MLAATRRAPHENAGGAPRDRADSAVRPSELLGGKLVVRLTLTTSALIVITCLVLSVVLVRRHLTEIRRGLVDRGREIGGFVARGAELGVMSGDAGGLRQLGLEALGLPDVAYCHFFDASGTLLVAVGNTAASHVVPFAARSSPDILTVEVNADVWEFQAPVFTTALRQHRELLLGEDDRRAGPAAAQERVGGVSVGIALARLQADRRIAFVTAVAFTVVITLLAVASASFLMHGTLRALAHAAALAEERSRLAELKAGFVTQASHEFRTPLAVILACCTALQRFAAQMTADQQRRRLAKIQGSVRHMTELLDEVLTLGRSQSGRGLCDPKRTDLEALCRDVVSEVKDASHAASVALDYTASRREATIDPKLVRQILRNLLTNAVKYSPDGGVVRLRVSCEDHSVTLRVADQGIGIPEAELGTIFEPFHRAANVGKIEGSGLGLAITRDAVELHGGTITVRSAPGKGTTFMVVLPDGSRDGTPPSVAAGVR